MESIKISPAPLCGSVRVPPSKSAAHRMLLCAALSDGVSVISPACHSMDIDATIGAIVALGARVEEKNGSFFVTGINKKNITAKKRKIDCGESGSTLRFIIPITAALGINATFVGHGRLPKRPIDELTNILRANGVECDSDCLPFTIKGKLKANEYKISGNVSSQYLTGLLLALPLVEGEASVKLTTPLQSAGYVDMTLQAMEHFGVKTEKTDSKYTVSGSYTSTDGEIEGDWSQACFFMAAAALGGDIKIGGLKESSLQGDKAAIEIFSRFGAEVMFNNGVLSLKAKALKGTEIDCSQIPDMVPALAVTAALAEGKTRLIGAERLRIKESDRIKTTLEGLRAMGIRAEELPDGLIVYGGSPKGGKIDGAGDHRIVMAFSVLASVAKGDTVISGYKAIDKSYPAFFKDLKGLGGIANVLTDR